MHLVIYAPDGHIVANITDIACVPDINKLRQLANDYYKFEVDGVRVNYYDVELVCELSLEDKLVDISTYVVNRHIDYCENDVAAILEYFKSDMSKGCEIEE